MSSRISFCYELKSKNVYKMKCWLSSTSKWAYPNYFIGISFLLLMLLFHESFIIIIVVVIFIFIYPHAIYTLLFGPNKINQKIANEFSHWWFIEHKLSYLFFFYSTEKNTIHIDKLFVLQVLSCITIRFTYLL